MKVAKPTDATQNAVVVAMAAEEPRLTVATDEGDTVDTFVFFHGVAIACLHLWNLFRSCTATERNTPRALPRTWRSWRPPPRRLPSAGRGADSVVLVATS